MSEQSYCPECGAGLTPDLPGGLCPRCLMGVAMLSPGPTTTVAGLAYSADLSEFKRAVLSIKLLSAEELEQFEPQAPGGAVGLARALIRGGKLPPYQAAALLHGKVIGNYFVLSRIGAGGMSLVFKARHQRFERG